MSNDNKTGVRRQLINVIHHNKALYHEKWFKKGQCVLVVEKVTMPDGQRVKRVIKMEDPTVRYAVTKPECRDAMKLPQLYVKQETCDEYESPVDKLDLEVAQLTDQMPYFEETRGPGARRRRRKLHDHRWVHGSDVNIADGYIDRYLEYYKGALDNSQPLDKAYADIEVDPVDHIGFPDEFEAPCPISLVTYFHEPTRKLTQFVLRKTVRDNPQIAEFEENQEMMRIWMLAEVNRAPLEKKRKGENGEKLPPLLEPGRPWEDLAGMLGLAEVEGVEVCPEAVKLMRCFDLEFRFFDSERDALLDYLHLVNEVDRPDVLAYWNASFDLNTQMNRLRKLNVDPEEAFTPKDFQPWSLADYNVDAFHTDPTEKGDVFTCTGYTIYIDQMLLYAQLRKTSGKKESYSLDAILEEEIGENKLEYDGSIRDLSYRDFPRFMLYGALDVVPMATLDQKTEDIAQAYLLSITTRTRIHKVLKKTICLANLARVFYRERGLVLSNNRNKNKERTESEKFRGAWVADPTKMGYTGIPVGGSPSNRIFDDVCDFDATALYPSNYLGFNVDSAGQLGRIVFPGEDGAIEDSADYMEALVSGDPVEIGQRWFGLPGIAELLAVVAEADRTVEVAA